MLNRSTLAGKYPVSGRKVEQSLINFTKITSLKIFRPLSVFLLLLAIGWQTPIQAQHCPFDGSSAVIIHLPAIQGAATGDTSLSYFLTETDTLRSDSCTYARGPLKILFRPIDTALVKKYSNSWQYRAEQFIKVTGFNSPDFLTVVLNQAETSCMIQRIKDGEFNYIKRQFEIRIFKSGQLIRQITVPQEKIYSLCTSSGSWTRIQPIEISTGN